MLINDILFLARVLSVIFIFVVIFIDKRKPESTIAWVLILTFLPYIGVLLYILLADTFRFDIHRKEQEKITLDKQYKKLITQQINFLKNDDRLKKYSEIGSLMLLNSEAGSLISANNDIRVYTKGIDQYSDLCDDINNAKQYIHISYYIIRRDEYGRKIIDLLIKKLEQGVEVRLIFDHIGSKITNKSAFKDLIKAGGKVEKFFPSRLFFKPYLNHRNHRKMVIIDGKIGYTGGMNIGKEYCNEDNKLYPWADRHIRIKGDGVISLQIQFFLDYLFVCKEKVNLNDRNVINKYFPKVKSYGDYLLQIVASGPDYKQENIKNAYLKMINDAKETIFIETPYLILDESFMDALKIAIKSGVEVAIVIPGIADKKIVYLATLAYARELIRLGAKVYTYKGFMHSKVLITDNYITSIGSANMDRRSFYLNFEINSFVYDKEFNRINKELVEDDILHSDLLNDKIKRKNRFGLWLEKIFRLLAPIL